MSEFRITEAADFDLLQIWGYVFGFESSDTRADRTIDRLYASFQALADHPEIGLSDDRCGLGTHTFVSGAYVIIYRRAETGVEIVRVTGADSDLFPR